MIQFINVNKTYNQTTVIEDLSFKLEPGTITGLVGRNGIGKSTLLRLIAGVLQPDAGIIAFNEQSVYDNPAAKKDIFFVSDELFYFSKSTIKEMKQFYQVFYENFSLDRYRELLTVFNFNENQSIHSFSKGMKRQLALIFGLAAHTKVILLDEAFDGLDPIMRFRARQLISEDVAVNNTMILVSSHNLSELNDICDSILILDNGSLKYHYHEDEFRKLYHKYRIVFKQAISLEQLKQLNPIYLSGKERIFTLILKGEQDDIEKSLNQLDPYLLEYDNVTLDEVFIHEGEEKHENIL